MFNGVGPTMSKTRGLELYVSVYVLAFTEVKPLTTASLIADNVAVPADLGTYTLHWIVPE